MERRREPTRTSHRLLQAKERRKKIWELRLQGKTQMAIATQLGVSRQLVSKHLIETYVEYKAMYDEELEAFARVDLARMDSLLEVFWQPASQGDAKAAMVVLKLLERRAKLLGLDAPQAISISVPVYMDDLSPPQPEVPLLPFYTLNPPLEPNG